MRNNALINPGFYAAAATGASLFAAFFPRIVVVIMVDEAVDKGHIVC